MNDDDIKALRNAMPCMIAEADFEANTVTLLMTNANWRIAAGKHYLIPAAAMDFSTPALLAEVDRLRDTLQFVERWANHHAAKPHMTPQEALSTIQHHPAIAEITRGYADGKVPDTPDPWADVRRLTAEVQALRDDAERWLTFLATRPQAHHETINAAIDAARVRISHDH